MKYAAIQALKMINDELKTNIIRRDVTFEECRIDHKQDMVQDNVTNVVLSQKVFNKICDFVSESSKRNFREFGTFFYGRAVNGMLYISEYTGSDFAIIDDRFENCCVAPTIQNVNELDKLVSYEQTSYPYNVAVHFHLHPQYAKSNGVIYRPYSDYYSEQDLYSYGYQQLYRQPVDNKVLYLGGLVSMGGNHPKISFVAYDVNNKEFFNLNNIYFINSNNQIGRIYDGLFSNYRILNQEEQRVFNLQLRRG